MQGSANWNTAGTLLTLWRQQTIAMIEVYLTNFNIFSKECVNVNGSPWYETSKYLLTVLTNWKITSSASYYQVSKQYYWTSRVAGETHVVRGTGYLLWWNILIDMYHMSHKYYFHSLSVKYLCFSYMVSIMTGNDVLYSVSACGIQTLIVLNYHNFYSILWLFLLSIYSDLFNLALVIHILVNPNPPNSCKVSIYWGFVYISH